MEFSFDGTINRNSMRQAARGNLKTKDNERIKQALIKAKNHGKVQIGQIAVIGRCSRLPMTANKFNKIC